MASIMRRPEESTFQAEGAANEKAQNGNELGMVRARSVCLRDTQKAKMAGVHWKTVVVRREMNLEQ